MLFRPHHNHSVQFRPVNYERLEALAKEVYKLQQKGVVSIVKGVLGQFLSPIFLVSPQIRWVLAANNQFQGAKHTRTCSPPQFQDGGDTNSEGPYAVERLEGCVLYLSVQVDPEYMQTLHG